MNILQNFAVLEGLDGSGTTTQLSILDISLPPLYKTFEPTDGIIGKLIRSALKKETIFEPETMAMLFAADRHEHLYAENGIVDRCKRGELVISDRYMLSSLVYQGISCGEELPKRLNIAFPNPELLIFLDIDPTQAQDRIKGRSQKEIYENLDFQVLVYKRYKKLLPQFCERGVRVEIINAGLPVSEVAALVWAAVQKMPIFKG